jgi:hypothetical protein
MINEPTNTVSFDNREANITAVTSTIPSYWLATEDDFFIVTENNERLLMSGYGAIMRNDPVVLTNYEQL